MTGNLADVPVRPKRDGAAPEISGTAPSHIASRRQAERITHV